MDPHTSSDMHIDTPLVQSPDGRTLLHQKVKSCVPEEVVPSSGKQLLYIDATPDALNHLQLFYGAGSQSTDDTPHTDATVQLSLSTTQPHP
jgi:hypothetical protein